MMREDAMEDLLTNGEDFRAERESLGLTRESLAHMSGVTLGTIYRLETGKSKPHRTTVDALRRALRAERSSVMMGSGR